MSISYEEFNKKRSDIKTLLSIVEGDEVLTKVVELGLHQLEKKTAKDKTASIKHKTTRIACPFYENQTIEIDNGIFDLISELWKANIKTCSSCEDDMPANYMWIEFCPASDGDSFLEIIMNGYEENDKLSLRILDRADKNNWIIEYIPENINEYTDSDDDEATSESKVIDFISNLSIRFPKSDYKQILKRIKAHNLALTKKKKTKGNKK
jgi:hypothetical protein